MPLVGAAGRCAVVPCGRLNAPVPPTYMFVPSSVSNELPRFVVLVNFATVFAVPLAVAVPAGIIAVARMLLPLTASVTVAVFVKFGVVTLVPLTDTVVPLALVSTGTPFTVGVAANLADAPGKK